MILDGRVVREKVLAQVRSGAERLRQTRGIVPCLAVVLVGDDPASRSYVAGKKRTAESVGIETRDYLYPAGLDQAALVRLLGTLSTDASVHAILLQLPLPAGLDENAALAAVAPEKDVDGLHPMNLGKLLAGEPATIPCTPAGCIEILDHYGAELRGAEAVVIGRSRLVGKPLGQLLLARHATVTTCHTRTRDLAAHVRRADILCVAAGRPGIVTGDMVKDGAWVIDVGFNRLADGRIVGDVDFESVSRRARGITPVPGGVGPMTIAMLLKNTLICSEGASAAPSEASPSTGLRGQSPRSNSNT